MKLRKIIASLLALTLVCGTMEYFEYAQPGTLFAADAADIIDSGTCGSNITWTLDSEGTLTFTGSGDMTDYDFLDGYGTNCSPYSYGGVSGKNYDGLIKTVIISDGITSVGSGMFSLPSIKKVNLPDSIKRIGAGAFEYCINLEEINIPASVESIGSFAFYETKWLKEQTKKEPLLIINGILVDGRKYDGDLVIPDTVKAIAGGAFGSIMGSGGIYLTSVTIPNSVKSIGDHAFSYCYNLTSVKIADSVTSIGSYAFFNSTSLETMNIPASVTSIGDNAFAKTKWLKNKAAAEGTVIINGTLVYSDPEGDFVVPEGVTSILENSLLGNEAFNTKLKSITIPKSVKSIDKYSFDSMDVLTAINVSEDNEVYSSVDGVLFNKNKTKLIAYPEARETDEYIIPDSVDTICSKAFIRADIRKIVIPDSVINAEPFAFDHCHTEEINIPASWTEIPDLTFSNAFIKSIDIPEGITRIGKGAFTSCLESIKLPSTLREIDDDAFCMSDLTTITIPDNVTVIKPQVFRSSALTSISLPNTITSIGRAAFYMCRDLESITIPDSVKVIDSEAFTDCESLESVEIPYSVKRINEKAFWYCSKLSSITVLNPDCEIFDDAETITTGAETKKDNNGNTIKDENGDDEYFSYFNGVIRGYNGSTAQKYAKKYGYKFKSLGKAPLKGDANLDGVVNAGDASAILGEYAALSTGHKSTFNAQQNINSDVNRDNAVNASDASMVLGFYSFLSTGGSGKMDDWLEGI